MVFFVEIYCIYFAFFVLCLIFSIYLSICLNIYSSTSAIILFLKTYIFILPCYTNWRSGHCQVNKAWWWHHCSLFHSKIKHRIDRLTNSCGFKTPISVWMEVQNCVDCHCDLLLCNNWLPGHTEEMTAILREYGQISFTVLEWKKCIIEFKQ